MKLQVLTPALAAAAVFIAGAGMASAAEHPAYLHALTDLKRAELAIGSRHGDRAMSKHEHQAEVYIQTAQSIIYKVAPEEHENVNRVIAADTDPSLKAGELHDALAFLRKAHADMAETESDTANINARGNALAQVDAAIMEVNAAIADFNQHK